MGFIIFSNSYRSLTKLFNNIFIVKFTSANVLDNFSSAKPIIYTIFWYKIE